MTKWRLDLWAAAASFCAVHGAAGSITHQQVLSLTPPPEADSHALDAGNVTMAAMLDHYAPVFKLSQVPCSFLRES